jgi:FeS assembly protein IscX
MLGMKLEDGPELYWDATYAIAVALMAQHPEVRPGEIGLYELLQLILGLSDFKDDPGLANERILMDIQITWFEEAME